MTAPASPVELPQLPRSLSVLCVESEDEPNIRAWGQQCYEAGVRAERERCAKLCEQVAREYESYTVHDNWPDPELVTDKCADAIRKGE